MGCFASSHIAIRVAVNVNVVVGAVICSFRWGEKLDGMCETSFGENSESLYGVDDSTKTVSNLRLFPFIISASFAARTKETTWRGVRTGGR